jgi:predicted secreted protein
VYVYYVVMLRRRWVATPIGAIVAIVATCIAAPYSSRGSAQTIESSLKGAFAQELTEGAYKLVLPPDREQIVRLPAQKGTGYMWFPTSIDDKVKIVPVTREPASRPSNTVGGIEDQYFSIRGISSGSSVVTFEYKRPHSNIIAKTIRLDVEVQ